VFVCLLAFFQGLMREVFIAERNGVFDSSGKFG
jgi:hypothetical protein